MHSDDEEDELATCEVRLPISSEDSDLSSVKDVSLSHEDSSEASETKTRERGQSSFSPSQDWDTDDQSISSNTPWRRVGPQSKDHNDPGALERRRPIRPPNKPWSAEEEYLIQEKMATQMRLQGSLEITRQTATKLMQFFPRRTSSAIRNKWQALAIKDAQYNQGRKKGKIRAYKAEGKVQDEDTERKKRYEEYADSTMEDDDGDRDASNEPEVKRGSHEFPSYTKIKWTPQQDQLLTDMMHTAIQSSGISTMPVPSAVRKKMARSVGCSERTISRRWLFLSGHNSWNGTGQSRKKSGEIVTSISVQNEPTREIKVPEASSMLPLSDTSRQSEAVQALELRRQSQSTSSAWSPEEHESIMKSTKGKTRDGIDFKKVAAELPDPSRRTADACRSYWSRKIQSLFLDNGTLSHVPLATWPSPPRILRPQNPIQDGKAPEKSADSSSKIGPPTRRSPCHTVDTRFR